MLFIPLIGVLVYLIARGGKMHERAVREARQQGRELRAYVQEAAGSQSTADQLAKLADLRDRGVITPDELEREKAKILPPSERHEGSGAGDRPSVTGSAPCGQGSECGPVAPRALRAVVTPGMGAAARRR